MTASLAIPLVATATSLGPAVGETPRYHLEGLVYAWLAVAAGLRPVRADADRTRGQWTGAALATTAVAVIGGSVVWSNATHRQAIGSFRSGAWIATMEAELAGGRTAQPVLATPIPSYVYPLVPGRRVSTLVDLVPGLRVDPRATQVVTADGHVEKLDGDLLFDQVGSAFATNGLVQVVGDHEVVGTAMCTASKVEIEVLLGPHLEPRLLELEITGTASLRLRHLPLPGRPTDPPSQIQASDGVVRLPMDMLGWTARLLLTIDSPTPQRACLDRVAFIEVRNDLPQYGDLDD